MHPIVNKLAFLGLGCLFAYLTWRSVKSGEIGTGIGTAKRSEEPEMFYFLLLQYAVIIGASLLGMLIY